MDFTGLDLKAGWTNPAKRKPIQAWVSRTSPA